ncbi:SusC/RagA family TonB-linked outer membrane protein [Marinoscillum furvescens]|uniref:TonB-linked SusC/RagA family outer membrane protein n=1 Tax=Marinoscillum furvescens DSM 4134 TaxID=1122208 RepID=A0A3D9L4U2_MARFU|nr:TonB-dependent receptor [Marinoscillum furvescens]RED99815.1 TonB-linked SusC/RagA family outer membrane protein [Marinoscillum furvescens DSM 4134]
MRLKILSKSGSLRMLLMMIALAGLVGVVDAQSVQVRGLVTDGETGESLPGVTVLEKGTTNGTITDIEGKYTIALSEGRSILIFSFVGFEPQEVEVSGESTVDVKLQQDIQSLEEVVVVGYGAQKKSVVTGAISSVKASDLETLPVNNVSQTLQGRVSGLTIAANSGQPGEGATIRVRGITTLNNNDPLWVVDGVVVDNGGINFLNQSDIASVEVLKDAASQAIYGARAAAGVILITTKKGKQGSLSVNYNGYYGTSEPARRLNLLNAQEYATLRNEASLADGAAPPFANPAALGAGTDWQALIFNDDARRQNHELSISGGNEKSTFYLSFGHLEQEGIVATEISKYQRTNFRLNSTHQVTDWLKVGQNLGYAHDKSVGLGNTNSEFGGPLSSAINLDPITPAVITDQALAAGAPYANNPVIRDELGRPYGISNIVQQEMVNPLAYIETRRGNYGFGDNIIGNVFAEVSPIEGLTLRSTLGTKLSYYGGRGFTPIYYLSATNQNLESARIGGDLNRRFDWNVENTISYTRTVQKHHFTALLGQGAYRENELVSFGVTKANIPVDNFDDASFRFNVTTDDITAGAGEGVIHTVSSLFARLNYNYDERYLLTAVIRRDGSSRFGANNKYGVFPSYSLGWVTSNESFWPTNPVVNFLKVRGGYGVVGNDNLGDFRYLSTIGAGRNYTFGTGDLSSNGYSPDAPANPDLRWEETSQLNIGFEATLFSDFMLNADWYKKVTTDILREKPIPRYTGVIGYPMANIGDMENTGVELELSYRKQLGELNLGVSANASYVENKVTNLGDVEFYNTSSIQNMGTMARMAVSQPINSFYGYKRLGVFQTEKEIEAHVGPEGSLLQPDAQPGDFIWADLDNDGAITPDDRTFLGSPIPSWTYGINVKAEYKGFDLLVFGQGVQGNKIFQGLRRLDIGSANYQQAALGRWTGPGTSNDFPRLTNADPNKNFQNPSDFYIQDGAYFRLKVVQLGYSLPAEVLQSLFMKKARVYVMAENLFTFTEYTGYDPEIGGGSFGIDRGIYPQARSFMVGINVGF